MVDLVRAKIRVIGRVQGVFFRKYTRDMGRKIGQLNGYVRNMRDGSVEILVEGDRNHIEMLIDWCKTEGSPWSKVEKVEVDWGQPSGDLLDFQISY
ncbi:MAG: acylphosphatase [Candidatus Hodarchaeales archaeon]